MDECIWLRACWRRPIHNYFLPPALACCISRERKKSIHQRSYLFFCFPHLLHPFFACVLTHVFSRFGVCGEPPYHPQHVWVGGLGGWARIDQFPPFGPTEAKAVFRPPARAPINIMRGHAFFAHQRNATKRNRPRRNNSNPCR